MGQAAGWGPAFARRFGKAGKPALPCAIGRHGEDGFAELVWALHDCKDSAAIEWMQEESGAGVRLQASRCGVARADRKDERGWGRPGDRFSGRCQGIEG